MQLRFIGLGIKSDTCANRKATFLGRQFRVVPAVLVRAQVLRNNLGATYLPAEEITDDWAALWNGIPVLVGPHPSMQGVSTSGRTPEIWNERGAGWIFYARADNGPDGTRRLVGEVWLDESRAAAIPGMQAVLARLDANQPVELSTGFHVQTDEQAGVYNGESYELVLHPAGADHLVISTEMTGACAVADGCGLGANAEDKVMAEDKDKVITEPVVVPVADTKNGFKALLARVVELFGKAEPAALSWDEHEAIRTKRQVAEMQLTPSDSERAQMIREALQEAYGGNDREIIVCDVYSDAKTAIFWFSTAMGPMPKGAEYYRASWTENADGKPMFAGEPELVRRQTTYEPVTATNVEKPAPAAPVAGESAEGAAITGMLEQVRAASERLEALKV